MKYILETFDGESEVFPCWRKAKAAMRRALNFTYSATIKPYRGRHARYLTYAASIKPCRGRHARL